VTTCLIACDGPGESSKSSDGEHSLLAYGLVSNLILPVPDLFLSINNQTVPALRVDQEKLNGRSRPGDRASIAMPRGTFPRVRDSDRPWLVLPFFVVKQEYV